MYMTMCDDVDRMAHGDRQITAAYIAAGSDITLAEPAEYREHLDAWLEEEPKAVLPEDADRARLLQILGVK